MKMDTWNKVGDKMQTITKIQDDTADNKYLGFKIYASKLKYPFGTKVINKKVMTIDEYRNKVYLWSDRTVWRYE